MTASVPDVWQVVVTVIAFLVSFRPRRVRPAPPVEPPPNRHAEMRKLCDEAADYLTQQIRAGAPVPGQYEWSGFMRTGERVNARVTLDIEYR